MQGMSAAEFRQSVSEGVSGAVQIPVAPAGIVSIGDAIADQGRALLAGVLTAVQPVAEKAISSATAALGQLSYSGAIGNFTSADAFITLKAKFQQIVETAPERYGYPLQKNRVIQNLPGFILCANSYVSIADATSIEEQAIETFMNNGFYYE